MSKIRDALDATVTAIQEERNARIANVRDDGGAALSEQQKRLAERSGTPAQFARAVWNALGEISVDEAEAAIHAYRREWKNAADLARALTSCRDCGQGLFSCRCEHPTPDPEPGGHDE